MERKLKTYLRTVRRRWGLTQRELAFLLEIESGTSVSRIETQKRRPNLAAVFACGVVFGVSPVELFPGLLTEIEQRVLLRANELYEELQGSASKATRTKLDLLESVLARGNRISSSTKV